MDHENGGNEMKFFKNKKCCWRDSVVAAGGRDNECWRCVALQVRPAAPALLNPWDLPPTPPTLQGHSGLCFELFSTVQFSIVVIVFVFCTTPLPISCTVPQPRSTITNNYTTIKHDTFDTVLLLITKCSGDLQILNIENIDIDIEELRGRTVVARQASVVTVDLVNNLYRQQKY